MTSMIEQAQQLYKQGQTKQMLDLMEKSAKGDDSECQLQLAKWFFNGYLVEKSSNKASELLERAAILGNVHAIILKSSLLGHGKLGYSRDWQHALALLASIDSVHAKRQQQLIEKMGLDDQGDSQQPISITSLMDEPKVYIAEGAVSAEECEYIATIAKPRLEPSSVVDAQGQRRPHPVRSSFGTSFGPLHEDLVIHAINRRIAKVSGTHVDNGEPLHILRYEPGQEYKPHFDAIPGERNQRSKTVLLYLNDNYHGGETRFVDVDYQIKGKQGDLLIFENLKDNGQTERLSKHAGLPVIQGQKWLATRWIRESVYHPW